MRIAISINDVLRAYTEQITYVHAKYMLYGLEEKIENREDLSEEELEAEMEKVQAVRDKYDFTKTPLDGYNLAEYFDFETKADFNNFLYKEASLEIFGHADEMYKNVMSNLNNFAMDIQDEEEHVLELVSRDVYMSIPATHFFLSKTACKVKKIRFVNDPAEKWDDTDVLITANPLALEDKPEGKISVKVKTPYNKDVKADFEIDSIVDFIKDTELRNEILKNDIKA